MVPGRTIKVSFAKPWLATEADLDAYLTRGDRDDEPDDCLAGLPPDEEPRPCGRCPACLAHAAALADEGESPDAGGCP